LCFFGNWITLQTIIIRYIDCVSSSLRKLGIEMNNEEQNYPKILADTIRAGVPFPTYLASHFGRILQKMELFWGATEIVNYFDGLLLGERDNRHGFPPEALREVDLLKQVHTLYYQSLDFNPYDPFSSGGAFAQSIGTPKSTQEFATKPALKVEPVIPVKVENPPVVAPSKPVRSPLKWPKITSQNELFELLAEGKKIYQMQGCSISEILLHYGLKDEPILHSEYNKKEHSGLPIGQYLVKKEVIHQDDLDCALCVQYGVPMVDLQEITVSFEIQKLIPSDKARNKQVVPLAVSDDTLYLAVADPISFKDRPFFTMLTGLKTVPVYASRAEIIDRLNNYNLGKSKSKSKNKSEAGVEYQLLAQKAFEAIPENVVEAVATETDISENDSTIINLVNTMILSAIDELASDIHIETFAGSDKTEIRFRQDGRMENFSSFPNSYHNAVVSRIKIMAGLDISEKRRPQDGKISFRLPDGNHIDLRISIMPVMLGVEFVTIRILSSGDPLPLVELGMAERDMVVFRKMAHHTYGLILVCGPTGSGKTTTLHSVMKELNTTDRKIWTVEDPVEIVQPHLCQVQVNNKIGVTFATLLRSLLRADPDIIMIGEMRDQETAKIALEASMTGHLVLSTLHTNSASETVARLLDLGIDQYNLSDALLAILAQRLARKLCTKCAIEEEASADELAELANEYYQSAYGKIPALSDREMLIQSWRDSFAKAGRLYLKRPVGCKSCSEGYSGRIGLYELLSATPQLRALIRHQSSAADYQALGITEGMRTLKQDGIVKILMGMTDLAQVHCACA